MNENNIMIAGPNIRRELRERVLYRNITESGTHISYSLGNMTYVVINKATNELKVFKDGLMYDCHDARMFMWGLFAL